MNRKHEIAYMKAMIGAITPLSLMVIDSIAVGAKDDEEFRHQIEASPLISFLADCAATFVKATAERSK